MKYAKYKVVDDAYYSYIEKIKDGILLQPNDHEYFASFQDAKRYLKSLIKSQLEQYKYAFKYANKLKEKDI